MYFFAGHVFDVINALPKTAHPMTQLTAGIMALQVKNFNASCRLMSGFIKARGLQKCNLLAYLLATSNPKPNQLTLVLGFCAFLLVKIFLLNQLSSLCFEY